MTALRIGWLLGWGIPADWFRGLVETALPEAEHIFVEPSPASWDELSAAGPFDWVIGYSLGALLLLQQPARASALGRVGLLAPLWAFPAETGAGGRIARANLRALTRLYRNDANAALWSFYRTAGVERDLPPSPRLRRSCRARLAYNPSAGPNSVGGQARPEVALHPRSGSQQEDRLWGLEQLATTALSPQMPPGWLAWIGENDALLNAAQLHMLVPALTVIPGATHAPAELIAAFAAQLE